MEMQSYNIPSGEDMTPQEAAEDKMIEDAYHEMLDGYLRSNHRKKVELIERAYRFAKEAHKGIRRRSGEPYILHPIAVARIASREIGLGSTSICAALLHDVVEDTEYTVEDIEQHFGPKIAQLVEGLTKISGGIFGDQASAQAENFRKLLLTMSEDIRVVLIKMADRLHNMRTLGSMAPNKQYKIAGETLYIYAPLAHRLGLFAIKTELEDLSFKYEHPAAYETISKQIRESEKRRSDVYSDFSAPICRKLSELGLKFDIKARVKSVYSIWKKMEAKHIPFEEVYDLYAVRIVFDCDDQSQEKEICWRIYAAITDIYKLHPDRTRDWIAVPKANGYQALHLTVMGPDGNWVEVQIRSRRMDEIAEKGFAAHWKYKIGEGDEESELNVWLKTIKDILDNPEPSAIDFLDTLKLNLFATEIVVFTPKGELITLPAGATILDLAFHLHTEIGIKCIAGKVNHKLVPINYKLQSGDQVEVLTSQTQTPQEEWAAFLVTAKARTRLRGALRKLRQPLIAKGNEILAKWLEEHHIPDSNAVSTKLLGLYHVQNRDELAYQLGAEEIVLGDFLEKALKKSAQQSQGRLKKFLSRGKRVLGMGGSEEGQENAQHQSLNSKPEINTKEVYILRTDEKGRMLNYKIDDCCSPVPGDDVMGFVNPDGSVTVHSLSCHRAEVLKASYGQRIVTTRWEKGGGRFPANLRIEGIDQVGALYELIGVFSNVMGLNMKKMNVEATGTVFVCDVSFLVSDTEMIQTLIDNLLKVSGVKSVSRV